jgi:hypothetical protein
MPYWAHAGEQAIVTALDLLEESQRDGPAAPGGRQMSG